MDHALLRRGKVCDHAVQKQCGLVEQALGRFHALHDDAARHALRAKHAFGEFAQLAPAFADKGNHDHIGGDTAGKPRQKG